MRPRGAGSVFQRERSKFWWLKYYDANGKVRRESSGSTIKAGAEKLLRARLGEVASGRRLIGAERERMTFEELERMIVADYQLNRRKSLDSVRQSFRALGTRFSGWRGCDIGYGELQSYAAGRAEQGQKPATIRRELALLHRAFVLAARGGKADVPAFPTIRVQNARSGFFELEQWRAVRGHLAPSYQDVGDFAYVTGWRIMEILSLRWHQVDSAGFIRLEAGTTKSGAGRAFPSQGHPDLQAVITRRREATGVLQRRGNRIIPWMFHSERGEPLFNAEHRPKRSFRRAWRKACELAGMPGRIFHDFRRTAVRNLERAGVARSIAMELVGHKTESVYRRYDIVAEGDLTEGVKRLARMRPTGTFSGTLKPTRSRKHAK